jgi:transposase
VCGTPRSALKAFEKELTCGDWQQVKEDVQAQIIPRVSGEETYLLVKSQGRINKEKAMRDLAMKRLETALAKLTAGVAKGRIKEDKKIHLQAGRLLGRYPSVASLYQIDLKIAQDQKKTFVWTRKEDKLRWKRITEGTYLIRTNLSDMELSKLWEMYTQLTEAEAAFRAIKSELMVRPIWHHKEKRVQAHILVAFLGYALWVTLKHSLKNSSRLQLKKRYDWDLSPAKALNTLSRIKSGDIILPTTDGRALRLRRVSTPEPEARQLLEILHIELPDRIGNDEYL